MGFKYSDSGVDFDKEGKAIKALTKELRPRKGFGAPLKTASGFTGLIDFGEYALSMCTDGVGSKLMIADVMDRWDTVGIDCIAMNVNDMICSGIEPLAFVDYLAVQEPDAKKSREIGKGLARGARMANISIIGGETASLPDMIKGLDLAGTCLGYARKEDLIDGRDVVKGDVLVGLRSSGLHSNGYSLVRKIVRHRNLDYGKEYDGLGDELGAVLLEPTSIYVKEVLGAIEDHEVKAMAHITGGGLRNLARIDPDHGYRITDPFEPHPIFDFIQAQGVKKKEMYQTFNMGMGFVMVLSEEEGEELASSLGDLAKVVGSVVDEGGVTMEDLHYEGY